MILSIDAEKVFDIFYHPFIIKNPPESGKMPQHDKGQ